ncbi:TIGR03905 family TSCPD domain-containing protein [Acetobacterium woodii]|uniref:TIGR03905 family TSCPD domain-containing protein n=1 Tax=Acetobacterium woodii TaxID=33952 RepID=UPI000309007E|nr:TIGR03905 family TSCPD domain-containing protein [Acetobacterium woodii]
MTVSYIPQGVCPREIKFDLNDKTIENLAFVGGCDGNLKALTLMINGKSADEVIHLFKGQTCGKKPTSCMDQLVIALEEAQQELK